MQKYFEILGLPITATDEEIENAYKTLKEKYSRERFLEGEAGNEAAKRLTKLETAYHEIMENRKSSDNDNLESFVDVENLIKAGNISLAQEKLDNISDRGAEWHYLQSVIFYKKNWLNESKKQLEIALNIEPHNNKYAQAYARLKEKMEYNNDEIATEIPVEAIIEEVPEAPVTTQLDLGDKIHARKKENEPAVQKGKEKMIGEIEKEI